MGATGAAHKVAVQHLALLLAPEDTVMMRMMRMGSRRRRRIMIIKMIRGAAEIMVMMDVGGELVSEY